MKNPQRGELWIVDLGMTAKKRPCLVLSVPAQLSDRALVTIVPLTKSARGSQCEVSIPHFKLFSGVFDTQNLSSIPHAKFASKKGHLTADQMKLIESSVRKWLNLP